MVGRQSPVVGSNLRTRNSLSRKISPSGFLFALAKPRALGFRKLQEAKDKGQRTKDEGRKAKDKNRKDRDIGYALATSSCEGVSCVDACTVAVLDVIAAFAVPDPSGSSQSSPVFSGPVVRQVAPPSGSLSLLRTGSDLLLPTLSAVDGS